MATMARRVNAGSVNRRALKRYGEFWRALELVGTAVGEAAKLAAAAEDTERNAVGGNWAVPTGADLRKAAKKAARALYVISGSAKKWEAELVSREWRR